MSFRIKKKRKYHTYLCSKNPKGNENRESGNKKRRKESNKDLKDNN